jgi:hypothetical protein
MYRFTSVTISGALFFPGTFTGSIIQISKLACAGRRINSTTFSNNDTQEETVTHYDRAVEILV